MEKMYMLLSLYQNLHCKFTQIKYEQNPRRIRTHDLRCTSPILKPLSYGDIQQNRSIKKNNHNI